MSDRLLYPANRARDFGRVESRWTALRSGVSVPGLVSQVRLDMLGRGFSLVPTPALFDDGRFLERSTRTVRSAWWKSPSLVAYSRWLERLLGRALPEESVGLADLEFRQEPAGYEDGEVDRLHADGSYLRSVFTLYGPTTIYRDGKAEAPVPFGQTLLMTAMDRARALGVHCTLHRRPGAGPERAVIVCSFEPHKREKRLPNNYPRVAQASRSRRGRRAHHNSPVSPAADPRSATPAPLQDLERRQ